MGNGAFAGDVLFQTQIHLIYAEKKYNNKKPQRALKLSLLIAVTFIYAAGFDMAYRVSCVLAGAGLTLTQVCGIRLISLGSLRY